VCAQVYFNMCKATGVKLDKKTLVWAHTKSVETSQIRQGNHVMESASVNWQNHPQ
jgi:hypothetical protein